MAMTTALAEFCDVGIFEAQLVTTAGQRSAAEKMELAIYIETPEFGERAARLERWIRDSVADDRPVPLYDVMAALSLPIDLAAAWVSRLGVPLDIAIGGRARA